MPKGKKVRGECEPEFLDKALETKRSRKKNGLTSISH